MHFELRRIYQRWALGIRGEIRAVHGNCRRSEAILRDTQLPDKIRVVYSWKTKWEDRVYCCPLGKRHGFDKESGGKERNPARH